MVELRPPMIGREKELEILMSSLGDAISGSGSFVLIAGEAGIGKTRLAEEFEKMASPTGVRVLIGRCVPGSQTPYLPFQEAFSSLEVKPFDDLENSKRLMRSSTKNERILFSTIESLRLNAAERPIILRLDDLQWADPETMQLIHFIARNLDGVRALIVGTYRPEDIGAESAEGTNPLLDILRIMRREGVLKELMLSNLDIEQTRQVIEGMFKGPIDEELVQKVACESSGNPLFIVETIISLISSDLILMEDGVWKVPQGTDISLPNSVREVIMARVDKLTKDQKRILDYASVIGERFDPDLLAASLRMNKLELMETLDEMRDVSHIVRAVDGRYQFCHANVRNLVYEQISASRRKEIHRLIAGILEKREQTEELSKLLSWHFYRAGDKPKAAKYSLIAGENLLNQGMRKEAGIYLRRAAEVADDVPELEEQKSRALSDLRQMEEMGDFCP